MGLRHPVQGGFPQLAMARAFPQLAQGWQNTVACRNPEITFRTLNSNYRALLRKMIHEDEISYGSSTYIYMYQCIYVYIFIYIYMLLDMYVYIYIYIYMHICVQMYTYV